MEYRGRKKYGRGLAGAVGYGCHRYRWGPLGLLLVIGLSSLTACETKPEYRDQESFQPKRIGILPDTQGDGSTVSVHPMRAEIGRASCRERGWGGAGAGCDQTAGRRAIG